MSDITTWKVERGRLKASLTKLKTFVDSGMGNKTIEDLKVRLEKLEELDADFKTIDLKLSIENVESEYDAFEDKYLEVKSNLRKLLNDKLSESVANQQSFANDINISTLLDRQSTLLDNLTRNANSTINTSLTQNAKLPKIEIPSFSGDYKEWPSFMDLFLSCIGSRTDLTNSAKLQFLKGSLKGEAANVIKHLSITDANYTQAWDKLVSRYNKRKHIVSAYMKAFMNQPACNQSPSSLRRIADNSDQLIRGIDVLGDDATSRNPWLIHIILNKLDDETRKAWADETSENEFPSFTSFISFLNKRCDALETWDSSKRSATSQQVKALSIQTNSCIKCSQDHHLYQCPQYKALNVPERRNFVTTKSLCFNCLGTGHQSPKCKSKYKCHICKKSHHTTLHFTDHTKALHSHNTTDHSSSVLQHSQSLIQSPANHQGQLITHDSDHGTKTHHVDTYTLNQNQETKITLLPTALVYVLDSTNQTQTCRVLLDSGSQASFISEDCVNRLSLQREPSKIIVHGLSATKTVTTRGKLSLLLISRNQPQNKLWVQTHILAKLTAPQPSKTFNFNISHIKKNFVLADPNFNVSNQIDIILGADYFFQILQEGKQCISPNFPILQQTIFGYVLAGNLDMNHKNNCIVSLHTDISTIDATLRKFWEIEELPMPDQLYTEEEEFCEKHFAETHYIDPSTNKYVVRLPIRNDTPILGQSLSHATHCLYSIERRFRTTPHLATEYKNFMDEYLKLGHMEIIPSTKLTNDAEHVYLPHHAIIKPSSVTTKVRVVFNGAAKTTNGLTLNHRLIAGPKTQKNLIDILLTFRSFKIAMVADIEKMYRQVLVHEADRNYQRIVWRTNPSSPIKHYWLTTVTYGTSCAPFLATRALNQLTIEFANQYPLAETAIKNNFYVDDFLGGAEDDDQALQLFHQLTSLLGKRKFCLRKWCSSSQSFMQSIVSNTNNNQAYIIDNNTDNLRVLGLKWVPSEDYFTFNVQLPEQSIPTKRNILSESSKIFDPLGLISPVTILFKILLQQLWLQKCEWDECNDDVRAKWQSLRDNLHLLQKLHIPRLIHSNLANVELHGFSDASERAYAAVIYTRAIDTDGNIHTTIVAAKSRVCPIKQISIPRLELCAAVLLTRLINFVISNLHISIEKCFAWTDSTVVLAWLSSHPRKWKSFVANRTSSILSLIPRSQWYHVKSSNNPADLASRGLTPQQSLFSELWWNGPPWLKTDWKISLMDNKQNIDINLKDDSEIRTKHVTSFHFNIDDNVLHQLFKRHSKLYTILRILGRCFQFLRKCRRRNSMSWLNSEDINNSYRYLIKWAQQEEFKSELNSLKSRRCFQFLRKCRRRNSMSWLNSEDINNSYRYLIKWAQQEEFKSELNSLKSQPTVKSSSSLSSLSPFIDKLGILRIGGRLENATLPYNARHPIILPKNHVFVKYLVIYLHEKFLHAGVNLLLGIIRQQYWIISCRCLVKSIINKCLTCIKHRGKTSQQLMANLPIQRVGAYRPFQHVGVDYAGPLELLAYRGRGTKCTKGYIVLFICFSTRAIHLELAGDLSTDTFLACLKRFIARRGLPSKIFSDNGTNFVGANRYLNKLYCQLSLINKTQIISDFISDNNISWEFNPPSAPHFGGLWEAGVKSVKVILRKVINTSRLTYEEMNTTLVQIEGLLNSRPLVSINDDPSNLDVLTPAHFLIGHPITSLPEVPEYTPSLQQRWQLIKHMKQDFWKRWYREYLTTLQHRPKWQKIQSNIQTGDLVTIKDDNLPPGRWILGRIIETHPGQDNLVRVATVRTSSGVIKRPITKLCKLPVK